MHRSALVVHNRRFDEICCRLALVWQLALFFQRLTPNSTDRLLLVLFMLPDLFHSTDWISRTYTVQMGCVEKGVENYAQVGAG